MATVLTRDSLISHAMRLAGNEDVTTFAQDWLNNTIDTLGQMFRWPELEKEATGSITVGVSSTVLPADFGNLWNRLALSLTISNASHVLEPLTRNEYNALGDRTLQGIPKYVLFDLNAKTWVTFPLPNATYTWLLIYHIKPARLSSDVVISFGSDEIFIQALYIRILQYEDDARYKEEFQILLQMIDAFLTGTNVSPVQVGAPKIAAKLT